MKCIKSKAVLPKRYFLIGPFKWLRSILGLFYLGGLLGLLGCATTAQQTGNPVKHPYTVQEAHSHNDYEQQHYFVQAYNAGFGSMEADIYLIEGQLLVAHNKKDVDTARTLSAMYLKPLAQHIRDNKGYPYQNHQAQLELLIDLKDPKDSPAYQKALELIQSYQELATSRNMRFTFTGNIPSDSTIAKARGPVYFDGVPGQNHSKAAMKRIYMLSDNFAHYSNWNGQGQIPAPDYQKLQNTVKSAHKAGKKIRFWNAPDNPAAWQLMQQLGVDYINTDKIQELSATLRN